MMNNNSAGARPAARPAPVQRPQGVRPAPIRRPTAPQPRKKSGSGIVGWIIDWFSMADHRYTAAKLALIAGLLVYIFLVLGGSSAKDVPFDWIAIRMAPDPALMSLKEGDANTFRERFGLDPDGCEGWLMYVSDDLMDVSELLIVKAGDDSVRARIEDAVAARLESQKESFRNYGTDQFEKLEHAIFWQRGSYLFYGVSDAVDRWETSFLNCIR